MTIRLIIAYVLNLFDLVMTNYWVNKYGLEIEGNPIGRWLYQTGAVYPVKIVGVGVLLWILNHAVNHRDKGLEKSFQWWDGVSWAILTVYSGLAIYHAILFLRIAFITRGGI